ncbi:hypothetical protein AYO25_05120 [Candidatus Liberibacter solanacearum]|uniref:DUF1640 domain-containing protein n=2 Tax=Candidatus Liberibacter solanacearum TaxID=556287 RepID=A0A1V2N6U0_9HYPH|nr:hypothetical protein AYO25_05120 [Candidatus Liberibacter solanacearum]
MATPHLLNYNKAMANFAEKEKTYKTSSQPLTEYRLTLLEKNYDRLENKVDKLSDKVDARFDFLVDKMDKESKRVDARFEKIDARFERVDARFEQIFKEIGNVRVEMHKMIWQIPAVLAVLMTIIGGLSKLFHWI